MNQNNSSPQSESSHSEKKIRIAKKSKIGFVCSGGAAKAGAYHLGVALALQEKGFKFSGGLKRDLSAENTAAASKTISLYVGSSAGSIICSYLAAGYTLEQIFDSFLGKRSSTTPGEKVLKRLTYSTMFSLKKEEGFLGTLGLITEGAEMPVFKRIIRGLARESYESIFKMGWLRWSGLFSTSGIERYMREDVLPSNDFQSYQSDLFIVSTQLNHSRKVVFGKYRFEPEDRTVIYADSTRVSDACAASTALPFIFSPYPIVNDRGVKVYYFDGEIRDTLSTHVAVDSGADLVIASYTHQPYHYSKEIGSLHEKGIPAIMIQALYLMIERKIQSFKDTHGNSEKVLNEISKFFKENQISDDLRKKCLAHLEKTMNYKSNVDYIYIHPKAKDHEMFFGDHFNLSGKKMSEIVRLGFRNAIDTLRKYEFQ